METLSELYERSFPDDERIPFQHLLNTLNDERIMAAVFHEEELVGMYFLFLHRKLVYLSYICVREEDQDKGYGTAILEKIRKDYEGWRIVVDIEEVREEDENYAQEISRRHFYTKNGFVSTGVFYHIYGVDYELLSFGGNVKQEEWHELISKHWGSRFADTAVYKRKDSIIES